MNVSIIILAKNEAMDLPQLLESIRWCDDVHVVDSGSVDATLERAQQAGAKTYEHGFTSFGEQRNWALQQCSIKHEWILFLDADEASTPEFRAALQREIERATMRVAGFYCCWKMMVEGRWLKRADSFPKWQFRLLRRGRATFSDFGHGQKEGEVDGVIEYLREPYLHFPVSKGWDTWQERHLRYAAQEAEERKRVPISWDGILSRQPSLRNKALKPMVSRIPGWPFLRFLHAYFWSGGFLEGKPAWRYCLNLAKYERQIQRRMREE